MLPSTSHLYLIAAALVIGAFVYYQCPYLWHIYHDIKWAFHLYLHRRLVRSEARQEVNIKMADALKAAMIDVIVASDLKYVAEEYILTHPEAGEIFPILEEEEEEKESGETSQNQ